MERAVAVTIFTVPVVLLLLKGVMASIVWLLVWTIIVPCIVWVMFFSTDGRTSANNCVVQYYKWLFSGVRAIAEVPGKIRDKWNQ